MALTADGDDGAARMLFHWEGVRRYRAGARWMRVRLSRGDEPWNVDVAALDELGGAVLSADTLVVRPVDAEQLAMARREDHGGRFTLDWVEVPVPSTNGDKPHFALLGDADAGDLGERYPDLRALGDAIDAGAQPPDVVLATMQHGDGGDAAALARAGVRQTLELLQAWLADERLSGSRLVLVTH